MHLLQNYNLTAAIPLLALAFLSGMLLVQCSAKLVRSTQQEGELLCAELCASTLGSDNSIAISAVGFDVGFLLICHSLKVVMMIGLVLGCMPCCTGLCTSMKFRVILKKCLKDHRTKAPFSKVAFALRRLVFKPSNLLPAKYEFRKQVGWGAKSLRKMWKICLSGQFKERILSLKFSKCLVTEFFGNLPLQSPATKTSHGRICCPLVVCMRIKLLLIFTEAWWIPVKLGNK